ncbi:hypothetical protein [Moorena sp. SIO1F2]|nr:hypothetical protein [Moorena sp. SIO1F2]
MGNRQFKATPAYSLLPTPYSLLPTPYSLLPSKTNNNSTSPYR